MADHPEIHSRANTQSYIMISTLFLSHYLKEIMNDHEHTPPPFHQPPPFINGTPLQFREITDYIPVPPSPSNCFPNDDPFPTAPDVRFTPLIIISQGQSPPPPLFLCSGVVIQGALLLITAGEHRLITSWLRQILSIKMVIIYCLYFCCCRSSIGGLWRREYSVLRKGGKVEINPQLDNRIRCIFGVPPWSEMRMDYVMSGKGTGRKKNK